MSGNNEAGNVKELQKAEAINRLTAMGVFEGVVLEFQNDNIVYVSEFQNSVFPAVLFYAEHYPGLVEKIKVFEKENDAMVYHVQLTTTNIGQMFSMFYVSKNEEEWKEDLEFIEENKAYVNVWNTSDNEEIGLIGFKQVMGGIVRTW